MIVYLTMVQTHQLNYFPVKGGVSKYYSPRTILADLPLDYEKHCMVPFGAYVQANHESRRFGGSVCASDKLHVVVDVFVAVAVCL